MRIFRLQYFAWINLNINSTTILHCNKYYFNHEINSTTFTRLSIKELPFTSFDPSSIIRTKNTPFQVIHPPSSRTTCQLPRPTRYYLNKPIQLSYPTTIVKPFIIFQCSCCYLVPFLLSNNRPSSLMSECTGLRQLHLGTLSQYQNTS